MLADRDLQLLTGYLDGELSTRQRKTAVRLLRKSSEARAVLQQLQHDSRSVRDLTRLKLGPDFPLKVMRTIAQTGVRPTSPVRPPVPGMSRWATFAMAASVLLLISGVSYWYYAPRQGVRVEGPFIVHRQVEPLPAMVAVRPLDPLAGKVIQGTFGQFNQTGLRLAVQDLTKAATRKRLTAELRQNNAYHVDVAVRDSSQAVNNLSRVLNNKGINVLMAASTRLSLQQKQPRMRYVLYTENLSADELSSVLQQLGGHTRSGDAAIEQLVVNAMTPEHRKELSSLLGVPANRLQPARKGFSDPPADLLNKTIIEGKPAGQGTRPMPPSPKTSPRRDDRLAVVLAVSQDVSLNPADSDEVRRFVSGRRQQRPGTLQVFLVVHDASV
jgi:hypothetical protein